MIAFFAIFKGSAGGKTTESMLKHIKVTKADPVKAPISLDDNTLYDELPEITKYPVAVQGKGQLDVEIFAVYSANTASCIYLKYGQSLCVSQSSGVITTFSPLSV